MGPFHKKWQEIDLYDNELFLAKTGEVLKKNKTNLE